jgi:hypothetical protein
MTREVSGTAAGKLLVRLMVREPGGVVITTGDQFGTVPVTPAFRFAAAHVAGATAAALHV